MDGLQLRDEAVRDRIRLAEEFLDRKFLRMLKERCQSQFADMNDRRSTGKKVITPCPFWKRRKNTADTNKATVQRSF